jgi:hypothetical protein
MFKSDEEIEVMLKHPNNGAKVIGIGKGSSPNSGGHADGNHIARTTEEKSDIAVLGSLIGNKLAGPMLGVSSHRVSQYKHGHNGNGVINPELVKENELRLGTIRSRAIDKVELFMEMLSTDKAIKMRGRDMASAAEKFVNIYEKLGPKTHQDGNNIQIIFHAPKVRVSTDYQVIDVEALPEG